tara:strand:- start:379 stop:585 length:207 start_codon:yes stop_codon:yes gene_type:complete
MNLQNRIEKSLNIKLSDYSDDTKIITLGIDSVKLVEFAGILEKEKKIKIMHDEMFELDIKWIKNVLAN